MFQIRHHPSAACRIGLLLLCIAAGTDAQTCAPVPAGAVAWYPAERHSDDRAGFHNGTQVGGVGFVQGVVGEAFRFDANDDFVLTDVTVPEQRAVRNNFTFELWARPTGTLGSCPQSNGSNCSFTNIRWAIFPLNGDGEVPSGEGGLAAGIGVAVGTDGVCVGEHAVFLADCLARIDTPITDWTHIVVVVQDKRPRIYLNGVLVHTGLASAKQFVFASWTGLGTGFSLGKYLGDLDEVTIYRRLLSDAEIATLAAAGSNGKCLPECIERSDDLWQAPTLLGNSGLSSNDASGMFGATGGTPEPGVTLFENAEPDGTVHFVEWQTATPVTLAGLGLSAFHEAVGDTARAFRHVRVQARPIGGAFATVYDSPIVLPYAPGARELQRCANLRPRLVQEFRAEFTQEGTGAFSGPRVLELDGFGLPAGIFRDGFE